MKGTVTCSLILDGSLEKPPQSEDFIAFHLASARCLLENESQKH